jgi:hypothetical protein
MELQISNYYDLTKFSNTFYLIQIALETYFANNIFRSDLSRIVYASEQYAFRQRLNMLAKAGNPSVKELQLPFMSYFRQGNWEIDDRLAIQNATAALGGFPDASIAGQRLRFLQVKTKFTCTCYANSDADAQTMYEALLWIQQPSAKQFSFGSMEYLGTQFDIPIHLSIEGLSFNPDTTEKDWLRQNRIIPIKFDIVIRSVSMAQKPQSPQSSIFEDQTIPFITHKVILDFLAYKYKNTFYDDQHIDFEVAGTFTADPSLNGTLTVSAATNTSITVNWSFNPDSDSLYTSTVKLVLNGYQEVEVARNLLSYTFTNLSPESLYNITIWFISNAEQITKYTASATTSTGAMVGLKGMVGLLIF